METRRWGTRGLLDSLLFLKEVVLTPVPAASNFNTIMRKSSPIALMSLLITLILSGCYTVLVKPDDLYDPDPYHILPDAVMNSSVGAAAGSWDPWWEPSSPRNDYGYTSYYDPYYYSYANPGYYSSYPVYGSGSGSTLTPDPADVLQTSRPFNREDLLSSEPPRDRKGDPAPAVVPPVTGTDPAPAPEPQPAPVLPGSGKAANPGARETRTISEKPADSSGSSTKKSDRSKRERSSRQRATRPR